MQRVRQLLLRFGASFPLRLALFLGLAWLSALALLGQSRGMNIFHDAQFLSAYERHARLSVLGYGQFPFWDPYSCGGLYGLAAPQTRYASPFFLFSLWLDVDRAAVLFAVLLPALGMEGMYRYARSWGARQNLALVCAPLFPLSGFFAGGWRWGWVQFLSFCGVPFILLGLRLALRGSRPGALLCAVTCALTIGFGGTWTLPMGVLLALFELLDAGLPRASRKAAFRQALKARLARVGRGALASTLLIVGIAAFRLWPMLESTKATLRVMAGEPVISLATLGQVLHRIAPKSDAEMGTYYLTPVVLVALLGLPLRRGLWQWLSALFILLLSLGHVTSFAPFALLRKLPVYDTIRYPERCLVLFALVAAVVLAINASAIVAWVRKKKGRARAVSCELAFCGLIALGLVPQIANTWVLTRDPQIEPAPDLTPKAFRQSRGNRWLMSHFAAEGMGSIGCGEAYPLPMSVHLRGDLPAEEYLVGREDGRPSTALGKVQRIAWSPNRIELQVSARQPVRLAINQNYHPGWRSSQGRVDSWDGLLTVLLPAGDARVVLEFKPRSGIGGMWVSLLSLIAGVLYASAATRGWQRAALLAVGPCSIAMLLAVWPEEPWEHPAPLTPDGSPVLLSVLPRDATPVRARFDAPLVLEAVRLPTQPVAIGGELTIDLFFRREGSVSAALGIFMHLAGPGKTLQADHTEISGELYLPRIPLDVFARDSFRVAIPDDAPAGSYQVRMGLWNAHGDGQRRNVLDPGRTSVHDNSLLLGTFSVAGTP